jgi:hypothetical protein
MAGTDAGGTDGPSPNAELGPAMGGVRALEGALLVDGALTARGEVCTDAMESARKREVSRRLFVGVIVCESLR